MHTKKRGDDDNHLKARHVTGYTSYKLIFQFYLKVLSAPPAVEGETKAQRA